VQPPLVVHRPHHGLLDLDHGALAAARRREQRLQYVAQARQLQRVCDRPPAGLGRADHAGDAAAPRPQRGGPDLHARGARAGAGGSDGRAEE
jgi:hypothetical protein